MIAAVSGWIRSVVMTALFLSVAIILVPEGSFRRIARLTAGLIFLLVALQGIEKVDAAAFSADFETYQAEIEIRREEFEKENETAMKQGIAERAQAYILDKAEALGLAVTAEVEVQRDETGAYYLSEVILSVPYHSELSSYITQTLGLEADEQKWSGG